MAKEEGRTLGEVVGVEVRLLRDGSPFAIEEDKGGEAVRIGCLENPGRAVMVSKARRAENRSPLASPSTELRVTQTRPDQVRRALTAG